MSVLAILKGKSGVPQETFELHDAGDQLLSARLRDLQQKVNERLTVLVDQKRGKFLGCSW